VLQQQAIVATRGSGVGAADEANGGSGAETRRCGAFNNFFKKKYAFLGTF